MNVVKEVINVTNSATTLLVVILAAVLKLAIDYIVTMQLVKVGTPNNNFRVLALHNELHMLHPCINAHIPPLS